MGRGQAPAARLIFVPGQLWILADAVAEIEAARVWYEVQRPGLGDDFLGAVETAVESLLAFPEASPIDYRDARRCLLERYPNAFTTASSPTTSSSSLSFMLPATLHANAAACVAE